jgi:hypothetical protein
MVLVAAISGCAIGTNPVPQGSSPRGTDDAASTMIDAGVVSDSMLEIAVDPIVDAGSSDAAKAPSIADASPTASWVPSIVGVGYGGLRVVSRDDGKTWKNDNELTTAGGDDDKLLRGVAYGNGIWVTVGWKVFTSMDGALTWTEQTPSKECGLMENVAFGGGRFIGTCGQDAYASTDGKTWTHLGTVGATTGHTYVFFVDGAFYASGDSGRSYTSTDGATWTELAGVSKVAYCDGALKTRAECPGFWHDGAFLGSQWRSKITRSTDGSTWDVVYDTLDNTPGDNAPCTPYSFAVGASPP